MEKSNDKNFFIANVKDKITLSKKRNRIQNTCFYTESEKVLIKKELSCLKEKNYFFFGGYEDAEREVLIIYPEKFSEEVVRNNLSQILKVIKITLPNELRGEYNHSVYLASLMKLRIRA